MVDRTESEKNTAAPSASTNVEESTDREEQGAAVVRDWLDAKPAKLNGILKAEQEEEARHPAGGRQHVANRMAQAEQRYQAELGQDAERIMTIYQGLSLDHKVELLVQAEEIAERNDQARRLARREMARHPHVQEAHAHERGVETLSKSPAGHSDRHISNEIPDASVKGPAAQAATLPVEPGIAGSGTPPAKPEPMPPHPQTVGERIADRVSIGSPMALTVNLPFTTIPGLPALSTVLKRIDYTTHQDLGFTFKGVAARHENPDGSHDLEYKLNYVGFGMMSSKLNAQLSPLAVKVANVPEHEGWWGGSGTLLTRPRSDSMADKFTVGKGEEATSTAYSHEWSYQRPSSRLLSTLTGGRYFGEDGPAVRIPAAYVPYMNRVVDALPTREEAAVVIDRVSRVLPVDQLVDMGQQVYDHFAGNKPEVVADAATMKVSLQQSLDGLSLQQQAVVLQRIQENAVRHSSQDVHASTSPQPQNLAAQSSGPER